MRQRAKMLVDVAMLEAAQGALAGARVGAHARAKKDPPFLHTMYWHLAPQLYGEDLGAAHATQHIINQETGWCEEA